MASNVPTIKKTAWIVLIPQLLFMAFLMYVYFLFGFSQFIFWGALSYLALSYGLRILVPRDHRKGIRLTNKYKFAEAIPCFEQSLNFFSRYSWIDNYRFLTLLSASKMSYREMGLCNIAFCHTQIGNGQKAKEFYQQTLNEYPENGIAIAALNMLNSMDNISAK